MAADSLSKATGRIASTCVNSILPGPARWKTVYIDRGLRTPGATMPEREVFFILADVRDTRALATRFNHGAITSPCGDSARRRLRALDRPCARSGPVPGRTHKARNEHSTGGLS